MDEKSALMKALEDLIAKNDELAKQLYKYVNGNPKLYNQIIGYRDAREAAMRELDFLRRNNENTGAKRREQQQLFSLYENIFRMKVYKRVFTDELKSIEEGNLKVVDINDGIAEAVQYIEDFLPLTPKRQNQIWGTFYRLGRSLRWIPNSEIVSLINSLLDVLSGFFFVSKSYTYAGPVPPFILRRRWPTCEKVKEVATQLKNRVDDMKSPDIIVEQLYQAISKVAEAIIKESDC